MAHRVKLVVAYLGQPFHGWQRQRGQRTVQGELEKAIATLTGGGQVSVVGAGRTDAGVHAAGQCAHVDLPAAIPSDNLFRGLNASLPPEIRVRSARPVGDRFHARKSALGKLYIYRARWRERNLPWCELRSARVATIIDEISFAAAVKLLPGRHDWASFTVPDPGPGSTIRSLFHVRLNRRRDGFDLEFAGEGFLRYQVRRMVGALLEVGWRQRGTEGLRALIEHPEPGSRIRTAPASGLCLERVYYRRSAAVTLNTAS
jgi:tRNA pseudouridine38-40 synthase